MERTRGARQRTARAHHIAANLLASAAGLAPEKLNFNIGKVGNTSAASIPIAIAYAIRGGSFDSPRGLSPRVSAPERLQGYAVMRIDPRIVAARPHEPALPPATAVHEAAKETSYLPALPRTLPAIA
jgi:3-oxoacyl-[acyl-carrier-protein] synthase-3